MVSSLWGLNQVLMFGPFIPLLAALCQVEMTGFIKSAGAGEIAGSHG